ncbi:hypothetical protein CJ030_MR7G011557 [Morella rubra]|uniref:Uncharacterized protein n=1 Tax=Morella rubra TaxID=262757 RepID=A0A6A1UIQ1_9ROSI|nr:hypothetical protein CJ030_MR0G029109 [Morella rubra]KAB1207236.1 hypothetical protein CJ030_MR7G011557 [Morella rubra]
MKKRNTSSKNCGEKVASGSSNCGPSGRAANASEESLDESGNTDQFFHEVSSSKRQRFNPPLGDGMVSQNNATGQCGSAGETNQNMEMSPGTSDVPPIHAKQECEKLQASVVRLATECSVLEGELMRLYEESRELSAENDRLMKLTETSYPPDANSDIIAVNSASVSGESDQKQGSPRGSSFDS